MKIRSWQQTRVLRVPEGPFHVPSGKHRWNVIARRYRVPAVSGGMPTETPGYFVGIRFIEPILSPVHPEMADENFTGDGIRKPGTKRTRD
jgi:hypothetical protein